MGEGDLAKSSKLNLQFLLIYLRQGWKNPGLKKTTWVIFLLLIVLFYLYINV